MAKRIVTNAGPLIALARIGQFDLTCYPGFRCAASGLRLLQVVVALRQRGHDVLTIQDSSHAGQAVSDPVIQQ